MKALKRFCGQGESPKTFLFQVTSWHLKRFELSLSLLEKTRIKWHFTACFLFRTFNFLSCFFCRFSLTVLLVSLGFLSTFCAENYETSWSITTEMLAFFLSFSKGNHKSKKSVENKTESLFTKVWLKYEQFYWSLMIAMLVWLLHGNISMIFDDQYLIFGVSTGSLT